MSAVTTSPPANHLNGQRLRAIRETWNFSQAEFAKLVRKTGDELGEPVACTTRLIQHWEAGDYDDLSGVYRRILTHLTGMTYTQLCMPLDKEEQPTPLVAVNNTTALTIIDGLIKQLAVLRAQLRA
jgi:hypothetical protein